MSATLVEKSFNGISMNGDAVMIDKYGNVYDVIDNKYHPNPGSEEDGYSEIERCINWLVEHNNIYPDTIKKCVMDFLLARVALIVITTDDYDLDELVLDVMYSDDYKVHNTIVDYIKKTYDTITSTKYKLQDEDYYSDLEFQSSKKIANYINEYFLRVRAGGKLNPNGEDAIYFRISSHGFDWRNNIVDFLWDAFGDTKDMPKRIVVCHDAETNPPEKILFDGTPDEFVEDYDGKKLESKKNLRLE